MATSQPELYDLLVVADATASMGTFLHSLNSSLQDIIRLSATTACFSRIGVVAYRDYDQVRSKLSEWSGWHSRDGESEISQEQLLSFVKSLKPEAGGDWPEATRTGLALAYSVMRPEAKTIILLYADAPPHSKLMAGLWGTEQEALTEPDSYGGDGQRFADWASAARTLSHGDKRAQVFSIIEPGQWYDAEARAMYTYLSTLTGGLCIAFPHKPTSSTISKLTVCLLLSWMGATKQGAKLDSAVIASQLLYADTSGIEQVSSEKDRNGIRYLPISADKADKDALSANINQSLLSLDVLAELVPRREQPVMDLARRYKADPAYQALVVEQLAEIIESDVSTIALNPVFGSLWRTVCNDRLNPARDTLLARFSLHVDKLEAGEKKDRLKQWLEESYDWAAEILAMVKEVPEEARYPCVFLDPTVRFTRGAGGGDNGDDDGSMEFTRDELLEIGRSCDYRILRRLGRILTRLTYVSTKDELPAHVMDAPESEVPRIPMALARAEHKAKFWKVLLHTVVPGTMLTARPAALLAALAVRMGIQPLQDAAYTELMAWRDNWNTLDIPETWNSSCLGLLLEADKKHRQQAASSQGAVSDEQTILKPEDRRLFETLVDYRLLEMNMHTPLSAEVGWTPDKSKVPLGPVAVCKKCQFPRSVTIMAEDDLCGLCAVPCECESKESHDALIDQGVSTTDDGDTLATWTECFMADCRAQYVVYHPGKLNVRAKCHYCRQKSCVSKTDPSYAALTTAPCVTCTRCANRIIWPAAYRPPDLDLSAYTCPACAHNLPTITSLETTAHALAAENGTAWLLLNTSHALPTPLANRSLFHTVSTLTIDRALLPSHLTILPSLTQTPPTPITLTLRQKPLHNNPALLATLHTAISTRRTHAALCSLCFTPSRSDHSALRLACGGRRGCRTRVCGACLHGWYGLNAPGRVVNVAALMCPFCRRAPAPNMGRGVLPRVGGVADAVREKGEWVYAWCAGRCGFVKRFAERVCARGVEEVEGWRCEECIELERAEVGEGGRREKAGAELVVKECPRCGVATEKVAGCDHIECLCGAHWCFSCGEEAASAAETYAHMTAQHRTWYGDGGGWDGEDYGEEEDGSDWEE